MSVDMASTGEAVKMVPLDAIKKQFLEVFLQLDAERKAHTVAQKRIVELEKMLLASHQRECVRCGSLRFTTVPSTSAPNLQQIAAEPFVLPVATPHRAAVASASAALSPTSQLNAQSSRLLAWERELDRRERVLRGESTHRKFNSLAKQTISSENKRSVSAQSHSTSSTSLHSDSTSSQGNIKKRSQASSPARVIPRSDSNLLLSRLESLESRLLTVSQDAAARVAEQMASQLADAVTSTVMSRLGVKPIEPVEPVEAVQPAPSSALSLAHLESPNKAIAPLLKSPLTSPQQNLVTSLIDHTAQQVSQALAQQASPPPTASTPTDTNTSTDQHTPFFTPPGQRLPPRPNSRGTELNTSKMLHESFDLTRLSASAIGRLKNELNHLQSELDHEHREREAVDSLASNYGLSNMARAHLSRSASRSPSAHSLVRAATVPFNSPAAPQPTGGLTAAGLQSLLASQLQLDPSDEIGVALEGTEQGVDAFVRFKPANQSVL